ncbi:ATP-binding cassette sub-family C member 10-like [Lytechinus variegatus]|uniref:ATP-binding cassette sub-family C member 10-like n=1 Tax=Lytechinus variegatus TaxID=7654 RepID=UPI001BB0F7AD|nr:ATP-binding cassette sub-family C member 10-like [Lytechinus variegatus]
MDSTLDTFCGHSLNNYTFWQHNVYGHCYEQLVFVLTSHGLLALVSALYIDYIINNKLASPNLKRSRSLHIRFIVSILSALVPVLGILLQEFTGNIRPAPVDYLVNVTSCLAWLLLSLYLWKLRRQSLQLVRTHKPVIAVWALTFVAVSVRLSTIIKQLLNHDDSLVSGEEGTVIASLVLQVLYLGTLLPGPRHTSTYHEFGGTSVYQSINEDIGGEDEPLLPSSRISSDINNLGIAEDSASLLSKATFWWTRPLMAKGAKGQLVRSTDVFYLPKKLTASHIETYFSTKYPQGSAAFAEDVFSSNEPNDDMQESHERTERKGYGSTKVRSRKLEEDNVPEVIIKNGCKQEVTLCRALFRAFGVKFFLLGIVKFLANILTFAGPLLLNALVSFMEDRTEPMRYGYYYALGLFLATFSAAMLGTHFNYQVSKIQIQVRAALITTVYRKSLSVSATTLSAFSTGQIVNFMSVDTGRIVNFCNSFHAFWSLPFEVAVALYLLYRQVGVSFLAGLAFAILLMPFTKCLMEKIQKLNTEMMKQKDGRVKMMNEVLNGIRVIKFYAWERHFKRQIDGLRQEELSSLKGIKYLDAMCVYFWATTPVLISLCTFTTYALIGNDLTAAKVFTSLALFSILIGPLNAFPWVLNGVIESWVSIKRVQEFMDLEESDLAKYYQSENCLSNGQQLSIAQGTFYWEHHKKKEEKEEEGNEVEDGRKDKRKGASKEDERSSLLVGDEDGNSADDGQFEPLKLQDMNLNVFQGQLVGVIGKVGSGKSSLFSAILADMGKEKGSISIAGLGQGFGLATQEPWLQHATVKENILFGKRYNAERYNSVVEACALIEDLKILPAGDETEVGENGITLSGGQKARVALARAVYQDSEIYLLDDPLAAVDADVGQHIFSKCIMGLLQNKTRILCTHHTRYLVEADVVVVLDDFKIMDIGPPSVVFKQSQFATHINYNKPERDDDDDAAIDTEVKGQGVESKKLVEEEEKEEGTVKFGVYKSYWNAVGCILAVCVLLSFVLMQGSKNVSDWWLSYWVSHTKQSSPSNHTTTHPPSTRHRSSLLQPIYLSLGLEMDHYKPDGHHPSDVDNSSSLEFYLGIYGGLIGANSVFTLLRAFLFAYGGIHAATMIHDRLLKSILRAPISFFDVTPVGRIINRFSSDVFTIDFGLPFILNILLAQVFSFLGTVVITCYGLPWFTLCLIPIGIMYYFIQNYYRKTSRELRRIYSISNSAIYSHFSETLAGLAVIKGMRATRRFRLENRRKLELNQRAWFSSNTVTYWLAFRLQMIGVAMVTAVAVIAVLEHHFQTVDPGLVGLAISYALSITNLLISAINTLTETEKNMISAERTHHYTVAIPEEIQGGLIQVPPVWPHSGVVKFDNVHFSYREDHPKALDGVSFETKPGEKIGIIGRTGSGKSTLFLVLFRMVQVQQGTVSIDGVKLADISLEDVRSKLAIIPQDPFIFSGTVRENLDPVGNCSDAELWSVLEKCHIQDVIVRMGGLEATAGEGGKKFSTGQKQLVCLARAMLTKAKVLCIDEATASIDMETDDLLQQAIREEFSENTVLTIAHRVNTLRDSDRILVMNEGKVERFGRPAATTLDQ